MRHGNQKKLFDLPHYLPNGLIYRPDFITSNEETALLRMFQKLPLRQPLYDQYVAKRRVIGYGLGYDFEKKKLVAGPPLPLFLRPIERKIAMWLDISNSRVVEALITEYPPGTSIGWHKDNEPFQHIVGVSLAGWARMRFRPLSRVHKASDVVALELEPRAPPTSCRDRSAKHGSTASHLREPCVIRSRSVPCRKPRAATLQPLPLFIPLSAVPSLPREL